MNPRPDTQSIDTTARVARFARAVVAQLNSPAYLCRRALLDAAVALHPNWSKTATGTYRMHRWSAGEPSDPGALLGWFTVADPDQAQAITERFFGVGAQPEMQL